MRRRPSKSAPICLPQLTNLFLDIDDVASLNAIVDWLDIPILTKLSLPCLQTSEDQAIAMQSSITLGVELMSSLVYRFAQTLQQVRLLNFWQCCDTEASLLLQWPNPYLNPIQEIVWGNGPPPTLFRCATMGLRITRNSHKALQTLYESETTAYSVTLGKSIRLGFGLRRLRIDQVNLDPRALYDFFRWIPPYGLPILMLYPWPDVYAPLLLELELPTNLHTFFEGGLATFMIEEDILSYLKVLAIGGYRFWIEREPAASSTHHKALIPPLSNARLWHLSHAMKDNHQRLEIDSQLSERDWIFLEDLPPHPKKLTHRTRRSQAEGSNDLFDGHPTEQMMRHRNYLTFYPTTCSVSSPAAQSDFDPTRWLREIVTWDN